MLSSTMIGGAFKERASGKRKTVQKDRLKSLRRRWYDAVDDEDDRNLEMKSSQLDTDSGSEFGDPEDNIDERRLTAPNDGRT